MALDVESVLDSGVNAQEAFGGTGRFEMLHLPLPPSCRLMRILGPIVCAQALLVASRQSQTSSRRPRNLQAETLGRTGRMANVAARSLL
jgi:hypothetical protein